MMSSLDFSELRVIHLITINKKVIIDSDRSINHEVDIGLILELHVINVVEILLLKFNSYNFALSTVKQSAYCKKVGETFCHYRLLTNL